MKAILVIEMPKSCFACPLWDESDYADGCMVFRRQTHDIDHGEQREEWCPLKPIPSEACEMLVKGLDAMEKMKAVEVKVVRRIE